MTYATIALHLDHPAGIDERIDAAARLARRFEAHLVGIAAAGPGGAPPFTGAAGKAGVAARARADHFLHRMKAAPNPVSCEAGVVDEDDVDALVRRSACCDLLVLSQPDPAGRDAAHRRDQLDQVVLRSAAPTLVLPFAGRAPLAADNVLVAWDGSHGAARAVAGALPLLRRAGRVCLVRCDTPVEVDADVESSGFDQPRDWLGRHGVRIDARLEHAGLDVGATLLACASDVGADLLVMGAWGQPRWAERLVGGVTRTVLSRMTIPVLMSH